MKGKEGRTYRVLRSVNHYLVFFLLVAFVITCCMSLFITILSLSLDVTFTEENIADAAKLTFLNVFVLSFVFTAIDMLRRKLTVDRPVKRITEAARKMAEGDFSVRIPLRHSWISGDKFDEISVCFNKLAEELSGTETLRTDFIANVSHELKTPLAIMQNYGTMLQQPGLDQQTRMEYAKAISDASRRLADLVSNILKLNKLENQQIVLSSQDFDLSEQLCQCLLGFEDVWEKKGINIETDIDDNVMIRSDPEMLSLVWNNLFSNAFKFTEPGGTVSLCLQDVGDGAVVKIADTGCGISRQVGQHIFDKFYQGDTSHATQGNGLGLALVKRVIDITESDISVESEPGKGTVFTVKIWRKNRGNLQENSN